MNNVKFEVPAELRNMAERAIDQSERAFDLFFDAASKSIATIPIPASDISNKSLSFTEQNARAAFDHARKLLHASDPQEAMQIQSEFLKNQMTTAREQMMQISEAMASVAKDATEGKFSLRSSG